MTALVAPHCGGAACALWSGATCQGLPQWTGLASLHAHRTGSEAMASDFLSALVEPMAPLRRPTDYTCVKVHMSESGWGTWEVSTRGPTPTIREAPTAAAAAYVGAVAGSAGGGRRSRLSSFLGGSLGAPTWGKEVMTMEAGSDAKATAQPRCICGGALEPAMIDTYRFHR